MNNLNMQGGHIETVVQNKVDVHVSLGSWLKEIASKLSLVPYLIAVGMLVATQFQVFPQGYYTGLRVAVSLCVVLCVASLPRLLMWPAFAVLVVYNPVWPLYLTRATWKPINIATVALLVVFYVCVRWKARRTQEEELIPAEGGEE
jgi:hypothetical protein